MVDDRFRDYPIQTPVQNTKEAPMINMSSPPMQQVGYAFGDLVSPAHKVGGSLGAEPLAGSRLRAD